MFSWWFVSANTALAMDANLLIARATSLIINPLIVFLVTLALLVFIWGIIQFIGNQTGGEERGIAEGKQHIIWGLAGLLIMLSVYGIMRMIVSTFNLSGPPGTPIVLPH